MNIFFPVSRDYPAWDKIFVSLIIFLIHFRWVIEPTELFFRMLPPVTLLKPQIGCFIINASPSKKLLGCRRAF